MEYFKKKKLLFYGKGILRGRGRRGIHAMEGGRQLFFSLLQKYQGNEIFEEVFVYQKGTLKEE